MPTTRDLEDLQRAAELLEQAAEFLADGFQVDGQWPDTPEAQEARDEANEMRAVAAKIKPGRRSRDWYDPAEFRELCRRMTNKELAQHYDVTAAVIGKVCTRLGVAPLSRAQKRILEQSGG